MKARIWLILAVGMLMAGCAPGYYEKPVAPEEPEVTWRQNPETQEEYERRIQSDRMGIEISLGKVGKVRGVAWPGTLLRPLYR